MKKIVLLAFLIFVAQFVMAQRPLTDSRRSSYYTYVYKVSDEAVMLFIKHKHQLITQAMLENEVARYATDQPFAQNLPAGNYLKVSAVGNTLRYALVQNNNADLSLLENWFDTRFILTDKSGVELTDAKVWVGSMQVTYDKLTGSYHAKRSKRDTIIKVIHDGVSNFFKVQEQKRRKYNRFGDEDDGFFTKVWNRVSDKFKKLFDETTRDNYYSRQKPQHQGFMVLNKPKYKARDTVKFKAFILKPKSMQPIGDRRLLIRLTNTYGNDDGKIIGYVDAYRKGAYEYNFKLDKDSLNLTLDSYYRISLETEESAKYVVTDPKNYRQKQKIIDKRKVYISQDFRFEDYELKKSVFTARIDNSSHSHSPQQPISVYFKATDENGLSMPDARVLITLSNPHVSKFEGGDAFVPDTLWNHQVTLDPVGETKVTLPDSIFPKVSISYTANFTLLSSDNESRKDTKWLNWNYYTRTLEGKVENDTLKVDYKVGGKSQAIKGELLRVTLRNDTLPLLAINIPAKIPTTPGVRSYVIKAGDITHQVYNQTPNLDLYGYRTTDSIYINAPNPGKQKFWYIIFNGNRMYDQGVTTQLSYKRPFSYKGRVSVVANYFSQAGMRSMQYDIPSQDKYLSIDVKQPVTVYPGQQAEIAINVKDINGKPVPNTDITAYSVTNKFENYPSPLIPYLGKVYPFRTLKPNLSNQRFRSTDSVKLNWQQQSKRLGLDTIQYYRFTHADSVYKVTETAPDNITQIAPFIVNNGEVVPVHILYVDEKPVYFSQTNDLQRYSFAVEPGKHHLRFRTANQSINTIAAVDVPLGKKVILSFNNNAQKNQSVAIKKMKNELTDYEAYIINQYMITVVPNFSYHAATLKQDNRLFLINYKLSNIYNNNYHSNNILVGPVSNNVIDFKVLDGMFNFFYGEANYSFEFQPGLIKQTSLTTKFPFMRKLVSLKAATDYRQYVLTDKVVDSLWQDFDDRRVQASYNRWNSTFTGSRLIINPGKLANGQLPFIKSIIVYKNEDPDYMQIFSGLSRDLGRYEPGKYRIFYLFKGDSYYLQENIIIKPHGTNLYSTGIITPHAPDSTSLKIAQKIKQPELVNADVTVRQAIKETFNERYLDPSAMKDEMSGYVLDYNTNEPLTGATIKIVGTNVGIQADIKGFFKLKVPRSGKLSIQFISYQTEQIKIEPGARVTIHLKTDARTTQEVVIRGYTPSNREQTTGATYVVNNVGNAEQLLQGKVAGLNIQNNTGAPGMRGSVNIRGLSTIGDAGFDAGTPLYVVDGVIKDVNALSDIPQEEIISMEILKDAAATALYGQRGAGGVMIITTRKGKNMAADAGATQIGSLRRNFSDYAYWQPRLTTDANGKTSFKVTYPDDITNWRTFVIGITNKRQSGIAEGSVKAFKPLSANFTSPLFAVRGDSFTAVGKILNYTTDTITLNRRFSYNGKLMADGSVTMQNAKLDTFKVVADGKDSISFEYTLKRSNGYFDGEKRDIPLFEKGSLETKGIFYALERDTTINLQFDPNLKQVTFRAEASVMPTLLEETERLRLYEYLCNEQLASKLKGLLAQKQIRAYLKQPFKFDSEINDLIKKLSNNRRGEGVWGWWRDTPVELWISLHATEALLAAKAQGYKVDLMATEMLTGYLILQHEKYSGIDKLNNIALFKAMGSKADLKLMLTAYERALKPNDKRTDFERYTHMLTRQLVGLPLSTDTLLKDMKRTIFGNVYWGKSAYGFFDNTTQLSLLAYKILKNEGKHANLLAKLRNYFMEQRRDGQWRNTYESALILENILPDMLVDGQTPKPAQLVLSGAKNETVVKFPYTTTFDEDAKLTVKKSGDMPVYLTAYQQSWNPAPKKVSGDFTVDTWFEKNENKISKLKGGEAVTLYAEVNVKADADFVMIEVPIPAGCSYDSKEQGYFNGEVHREYYKNKVSIFCRKLSAGTYKYAIKLMPRYGGNYNLNPAKAEMMYFPVFYGREGMKMINVD